jgi:low affinity Fe/Cu permease
MMDAVRFNRVIGSPKSIFLHTLIFGSAILLLFLGIFPFDQILLVLNTAVSLEAIYLSLFIQMAVNRSSDALAEISQDIEDIQDDVTEIVEEVSD